MNNNNIQILIDRYLNGVTTPDEEKLLARELLRDDIPDDWKVVRLMLGELAMGEAEYDADMAEEAKRKKVFVLPAAVRWLAAAGVALLIGFVCFNYAGRHEEKVVAKTGTKTAVEQKGNDAISEKEPAGSLPTSEQLIADDKPYNGNLLADQKSHNNTMPAGSNEQDMDEHQSETVQDAAPYVQDDYTASMDENLHYASLTANDTLNNYKAPSRMEEFIVKLADYNRVKGESLACAPSKDDSLTVCTAYVFEDTKAQNLFSRLLQAACWYDDTTPGYLLNYSHQQFFFRLNDLRLGRQYLWIAERIRGKILLYSTHSPMDTEVSSDCFREYRDKLSNTSINPNSKKL